MSIQVLKPKQESNNSIYSDPRRGSPRGTSNELFTPSETKSSSDSISPSKDVFRIRGKITLLEKHRRVLHVVEKYYPRIKKLVSSFGLNTIPQMEIIEDPEFPPSSYFIILRFLVISPVPRNLDSIADQISLLSGRIIPRQNIPIHVILSPETEAE